MSDLKLVDFKQFLANKRLQVGRSLFPDNSYDIALVRSSDPSYFKVQDVLSTVLDFSMEHAHIGSK